MTLVIQAAKTGVANTFSIPVTGLKHWRLAAVIGSLDQAAALVAARVVISIRKGAIAASSIPLVQVESGSIAAAAVNNTWSAGINVTDASDLVAGTFQRLQMSLPTLEFDGAGKEFAGLIVVNLDGGDANSILAGISFTLDRCISVHNVGATQTNQ